MKYEKAVAKIYDLGNEEILTCSGPTANIPTCPTTFNIQTAFNPFAYIMKINWPKPKYNWSWDRPRGRR